MAFAIQKWFGNIEEKNWYNVINSALGVCSMMVGEPW